MKSNRAIQARSASWLTTRAEVIAQSASTDRWGRQLSSFPLNRSHLHAACPSSPAFHPQGSLLACLVTHGYGIPVLSNQFHTRSKVNLRNERRKVNIETSRFEIYRDGAQRTLVGERLRGREGGDNISKSAPILPFLATCIELHDKNIFLSFEFRESSLLLLLNFRIFRIDGFEESWHNTPRTKNTFLIAHEMQFVVEFAGSSDFNPCKNFPRLEIGRDDFFRISSEISSRRRILVYKICKNNCTTNV